MYNSYHRCTQTCYLDQSVVQITRKSVLGAVTAAKNFSVDGMLPVGRLHVKLKELLQVVKGPYQPLRTIL